MSTTTEEKQKAESAVVKIRKSGDRGQANHGWLNSYHTFSFASYYDSNFPGFHSFRVLNEDRVDAAEGFPTHPHSDYEIFSYVVNGALKHRDSMNNSEVIGRGMVQFTSAGTGISHSEFNASDKDMVHFLQLWVKPSKLGLRPSYQTRRFDDTLKQGKLKLIIAPDGDPTWKEGKDGKDGKEGQQEPPAIQIHQDVRVYASLLKAGERVTHELAPGREGYIHLIQHATGLDTEADDTAIKVNGSVLRGGDGAFLLHAAADKSKSAPASISIEGAAQDGVVSEFLLLDIAARKP